MRKGRCQTAVSCRKRLTELVGQHEGRLVLNVEIAGEL